MAKEPEGIYNLNVNKYHTYFVSKMSVLVHNIGCTPEEVAEFAKNLRETGNSEVDTLVKDGAEAGKAETLKGKDVYGPHYEEAQQLFEEDPDFFSNPDKSIIVKGEDLKKAIDDYNPII